MNQGSDETRIQGRNTRSIWQKQLELCLTGSKFESYHYHWKNINCLRFFKFTNFSQKSKVCGNNWRKPKSDINPFHTRISRP